MLVEAKVVASSLQEQFIDFEIVVEAASSGVQETLRLSGHEGSKILLWPGEYYRVIKYGIGSATLEYLSPEETRNLFSMKPKRKGKR